jgi:hypothetical protein
MLARLLGKGDKEAVDDPSCAGFLFRWPHQEPSTVDGRDQVCRWQVEAPGLDQRTDVRQLALLVPTVGSCLPEAILSQSLSPLQHNDQRDVRLGVEAAQQHFQGTSVRRRRGNCDDSGQSSLAALISFGCHKS